jgi:hypothetical protein
MPDRRSNVCTASHVTAAGVIPLEVCIKEHKYNLTQGLLEESKLDQHHIQEIQGISPHISTGPSDQSTQFGHFSHLDPCYHSRSQRDYNAFRCSLSK